MSRVRPRLRIVGVAWQSTLSPHFSLLHWSLTVHFSASARLPKIGAQSSQRTDDDDLPSAYSEDLGTIEIKLRRVRDFIRVQFTPRTPQPGGPVHERKTRGRGTGSHCVLCVHHRLPDVALG